MDTFFEDDKGYTEWCRENKNGFVLNFFGGSESQGSMNKIHRADCRHLWRTSDEGKRTTTYPKQSPAAVKQERRHNYVERHLVKRTNGYGNSERPNLRLPQLNLNFPCGYPFVRTTIII